MRAFEDMRVWSAFVRADVQEKFLCIKMAERGLRNGVIISKGEGDLENFSKNEMAGVKKVDFIV